MGGLRFADRWMVVFGYECPWIMSLPVFGFGRVIFEQGRTTFVGLHTPYFSSYVWYQDIFQTLLLWRAALAGTISSDLLGGRRVEETRRYLSLKPLEAMCVEPIIIPL